VLRGNPWDGPEGSAAATTDATGAVRFTGVEAGAHALWRDVGGQEGELLTCVRVAPGVEVDVEVRIGELVPVELDLSSLPPDERALDGVLVGLDAVFGLCAIDAGRVAGGVRPGRYWIATRPGLGAELVVGADQPRVHVPPGPATLVVRSARRANVQVVPADADAFTRLMAARAWVKAEGETQARFRLEPGRYRIVGEAGAVLREVDCRRRG
jgi:hypothetical protein